MDQAALDKINSASARYAALERVLDKCRLPGMLLGAAAGVALVAFVAAPLMGLTLAGIAMGGTLAAVIGGGTAFGFIDKYCDRFGLRNLALAGMKAGHHMERVEHEFRQSLPLKDEAKKAFIRALTDGIAEKLHIRKPLQLQRKPAQTP